MTDVNFDVDFTDTDTDRFSEKLGGGGTFKTVGFNTCMRAVIVGGEKVVAKSGSPMINLDLIPLIGEAGEEEMLESAKLGKERLVLPFANPGVEGHTAPGTFWRLENFVNAEVEEGTLPDRRTEKKEYTKAIMQRGKAYWTDPLELKDTVVYIVTNSEAEDSYEKDGETKVRSWRGIAKLSNRIPKGYVVATTEEEIFG